MSKVGIKETIEAQVAVNELALFLVERFKDGFQAIEDGVAIFDKLKNDADFRDKLIAAYDNYGAIPAEVKDIDLLEGVELAKVQLDYVPKFVDQFKGKEG